MKTIIIAAIAMAGLHSAVAAESPISLVGIFDREAGTKDHPRSELTFVVSWPPESGMLACESVELARLVTQDGEALPVEEVAFEESSMSIFKRGAGSFLVEAELPAEALEATALAVEGSIRARLYSTTVTQSISDLEQIIGEPQHLADQDELWLSIDSLDGDRLKLLLSEASLSRIAELRFMTADDRQLRVVSVAHSGLHKGKAGLNYDLGAPRSGGPMAPVAEIEVDLIGGKERQLEIPFAIERLPGNGDQTEIQIIRRR